MKLTALFLDVETSDQYGTSSKLFIGVFDDAAVMANEKIKATNSHRNVRTSLQEIPVEVNQPNEGVWL